MAVTIAIGRQISLRPVKIHKADVERIPHSHFDALLDSGGVADRFKVGPPRVGPTYASSNSGRMTVDDRGQCVAVSAGAVTITATFPDSKTATFDFTVVAEANQADSYALIIAQEVVSPVKQVTG